MVINEAKISNIMGDLQTTSGIPLNANRRKLKQRFDIVKKLGQGTYGKVQLAINKETGEEVAIKTIKKCMIETDADLVRIRREIQIMSSVQHPNIIHIYEVFENREKMVLVMEYASGGELYDYLSERKVLEEEEARRIFRQIAIAVYYCHKHMICHRDLKLENILLDADGNAKIADFGLSNVFNGEQLLSTFCGSPLYASPEIVNGAPYMGPEVDCWSLGVLLYTLVYGAMPFDGSNFKRLVKQISNGYFFEPSSPSSASELIHEILTVSPQKRANIEHICSHWWLNETYTVSCLDIAQQLASQTPVRLDLLLSLVPPHSSGAENIVITDELDGECFPLNDNDECNATISKSQSDSNISISSIDWSKSVPKRKLEVTISTENANQDNEPSKRKDIYADNDLSKMAALQCSATFVIEDANSAKKHTQNACDNDNELSELPVSSSSGVPLETKGESKIPMKKKIVKKKAPINDGKSGNTSSNIPVVSSKPPISERRSSKIFETAEKFQNLLLENQQNKVVVPPTRRISIPGTVNVGGFKKEFERKASLTTTPSSLPITKPTVQKKSLISPLLDKFSQEKQDRSESENDIRRKKAIHIISNAIEENRKAMMKPRPSVNYTVRSMSLNCKNDEKQVEYPVEKTQSENTASLRSSSTYDSRMDDLYQKCRNTSSNMTSQSSDSNCPSTSRSSLNDTNTNQSKECIIPIKFEKPCSVQSRLPKQTKPPVPSSYKKNNVQSFRSSSLNRQSNQESSESSIGTPACEAIRRSPREFIIPISMEGGGFVTPRESSVDKTSSQNSVSQLEDHQKSSSIPKFGFHRRISSTSSDQDDINHSLESRRRAQITRDFDNDDKHNNLFNLHRLRSTRPFQKSHLEPERDNHSSGEEDDDENFDILTAENLFSTLLQRVRNLTQQMNSAPDFDDTFFSNVNDEWSLQSSMLRKPRSNAYSSSTLPRDKLSKKKKAELIRKLQSKLTDEELLALLTPGLSRRLQEQLLRKFLSKDLNFKKLQGEKDNNQISTELQKITKDISEFATKSVNNESPTTCSLTSDSASLVTQEVVPDQSQFKEPQAPKAPGKLLPSFKKYDGSKYSEPPKTSANGVKGNDKSEKKSERPKSLALLNERPKLSKNVMIGTSSKLPVLRKKSIQTAERGLTNKSDLDTSKRYSLPILDDKLMRNHANSLCSTNDDDMTSATTASFDSWSACSSDLISPTMYSTHRAATTSRSITPRFSDETESISDRIRRKSFYTRFNEWKSPRKTSAPSSSTNLLNYANYGSSTIPRRSFDSSLSCLSRPIAYSNRKCERSQSVTGRSYSSPQRQITSLRSSRYQVTPITNRYPTSFTLPAYRSSLNRLDDVPKKCLFLDADRDRLRNESSSLKMSARNTYLMDNVSKPRHNKCSRILHFAWQTVKCLFSHITLVSLVVSYCILGAFTFESLEAEHEKEVKRSIKSIRANTTEQLWALTTKSLVLRQDNWTLEAIKELRQFEKGLLKAITEKGWDGNEDLGSIQWTFSGALFFSIIVITTIGYGHIAPKTHWGKVVTIFYAILGIPMMLLCLSNIGDMMATSFKFLYWRICCYVCTKKPKRRRHRSGTRKGRKPLRRSMRRSHKSVDSGLPTTHISPSFSDTEFSNKRLSPIKQLIRGGSLDRRRFQNKIPNVEQIKRTPIFCNKYVAKDFDDIHTHSRRQSTPIITYSNNNEGSRLKPIQKHSKKYLSPPSPHMSQYVKTYKLTEENLMVDEKNESPRRKKRANSSYTMSSPRIMSPMGFAVQRRHPRYETDSESEKDLESSELSTMIQNSRSTTKVKPVPIWLCVFLVISYIIGGAFLFKAWENWKFLDSAYFCFITLTTIGFGDFVPAKRVKQNAEVSIALCSLYLLFGISLLAMSFNLVQEEVIANVKSVARKLGIIKSIRYDSNESSTENNNDSDMY